MQDGTVLYETGYFRKGSSDLLSQGIEQELQKLRPLMVSLVEMMDDQETDSSAASSSSTHEEDEIEATEVNDNKDHCQKNNDER